MLLAIALLLAASGAYAAPPAEVAHPDIRVSSGRIVSGWEANEGDYPYAIALRMTDETGGVSSCTGAIIHHEWGLTAGHCTTIRVTIIIRAGSINHLTPKIIFETQDFYHPPGYREGIFLQINDISLLKFNRFVEYTDAIQPLRLQSSAQKNDNYKDVRMEIAGWGLNATDFRGGVYPEKLNWVYVLGMENQECRRILANTPLVADTTVCSMAFNVSSQSPCDGDSGGPLVIEDVDGKHTSIGVASFSSGAMCESYSPSGYIRPGHFHDWFLEVTGVNFDWEPEWLANSKEEESSAGEDVGKVQIVESADA